MKTDVILISSEGSNMETALSQAEKIARYKELSPKNTLYLRLLTEETMSMVRAIVGSVSGEFWIEDDADVYTLHLRVNTLMDDKKKEQLISASTSGVNEATRGFMGKIRASLSLPPACPCFPWASPAVRPPCTAAMPGPWRITASSFASTGSRTRRGPRKPGTSWKNPWWPTWRTT
jgi:hypothetical protein